MSYEESVIREEDETVATLARKRRYQELLQAAERTFEMKATRIEMTIKDDNISVIVTTSSDVRDQEIIRMISDQLQTFIALRYPTSPESEGTREE